MCFLPNRLLNKCDLVTDTHLKKIESHINGIKKEPRILRSINSEVSLQTIMSVGLFETDTFKFKEKINKNEDSHDHSSHSHDHSSHSHDLINNIEVKKIIKEFSKSTKSEVITLSTLEKRSVSQIKAKLISYAS